MLTRDIMGFSHNELQELFDPVKNHKSIGLAVSGGADSLALLVLVHRWVKHANLGLRVIVYTIDHGLRAEAAAECENVEIIATQFGFDSRTLNWQGVKPTTGIQAAARQARYILIGQAMREEGIETLLTGHHEDDQAETILMRLAHSSGIAGLRGMENITEIMGTRVFRPFLAIPKIRLVDVVRESDLEIARDPSNEDTKYERVRWRNLLEPLAEMGLKSSVLNKFARRMGRANAALNEIAQNEFDTNVKIDQFGVGSISLKTFVGLGAETSIRVLSRMIFSVSGGRSKGGLGQLEMIVEMIANLHFKGVAVGGCMVQKFQTFVVVFREVSRVECADFQLLPAKKIIWDQRFSIENESRAPVRVKLAKEMTRDFFEQRVTQKISIPIAGLRAAPMIIDQTNNALAIGAYSFAPDVTCKLIEYKNDQYNFGLG